MESLCKAKSLPVPMKAGEDPAAGLVAMHTCRFFLWQSLGWSVGGRGSQQA